jgi:hypothetical protein
MEVRMIIAWGAVRSWSIHLTMPFCQIQNESSNRSKEEKRAGLKKSKSTGARELRDALLLLYHGCSRPSQVQNRPWSAGVKRAITCRMPQTLSSTNKDAPAPPMSVRTHPGCMTIAMSPPRPHAEA